MDSLGSYVKLYFIKGLGIWLAQIVEGSIWQAKGGTTAIRTPFHDTCWSWSWIGAIEARD